MRSRACRAFLLIATVTWLSACSQGQPILKPAARGVVRIVSSLPSRGATALRSREITDALRSAIAENSMPPGLNVEYIPLDDSDEETGDWSPRLETANANAAANDPSVLAYIGPYNSGAAMLAIPVASNADLPVLSPSAAWPGLTMQGWDPQEPDRYYPTGNRTFFRLMPADSVQAAAAAMWASVDGQRTMAILDDGSSYSAGLAREFEKAAATSSISITGTFELTKDNEGTLLSELAPVRAAFYAPSSTGLALELARTLNRNGVTIYSTDTALNGQFLSGAGESANSWRVISNSAPPSSEGNYRALTRSGRVFPSQFAANAYDLANLVLDGIASSDGTTRAGLLRYLKRAERLTDGSSKRYFDDLGDPTAWTLSGYVIFGGSFRLTRTFSSDGAVQTTVSVP